MTSKEIRVCIIEDSCIVRAGLAMLLSAQPDIDVVAEAADKQGAIAAVTREQPDILLFDTQLGQESALNFIEELFVISKARLIVLTAMTTGEDILRAIQAGVSGLVFRNEDPQVLLRAIRNVHKGEAWLPLSLMTTVLTNFCRARQLPKSDPELLRIATLTARERQIVALASTGLNRRGIADKLFLSEGTVRNHLTSIFGKLELSNQLGLVLFAQRHGLDKPAYFHDQKDS